MSLTKSIKQRTHSQLEQTLSRIGENYHDVFWRTIIGNMAKNIFPKTGFNLYNSELSYGLGVRKDKLYLTGTDEEIAQSIISFMQTKTAIYSPSERVHIMQQVQDNQGDVKKMTWTRFKLSDENRLCIKDYIKTKYAEVPPHMKIKIYNLVIYGLNNKIITEEMFEYKAGKIINITAIEEYDNNYRLKI